MNKEKKISSQYSTTSKRGIKVKSQIETPQSQARSQDECLLFSEMRDIVEKIQRNDKNGKIQFSGYISASPYFTFLRQSSSFRQIFDIEKEPDIFQNPYFFIAMAYYYCEDFFPKIRFLQDVIKRFTFQDGKKEIIEKYISDLKKLYKEQLEKEREIRFQLVDEDFFSSNSSSMEDKILYARQSNKKDSPYSNKNKRKRNTTTQKIKKNISNSNKRQISSTRKSLKFKEEEFEDSSFEKKQIKKPQLSQINDNKNIRRSSRIFTEYQQKFKNLDQDLQSKSKKKVSFSIDNSPRKTRQSVKQKAKQHTPFKASKNKVNDFSNKKSSNGKSIILEISLSSPKNSTHSIHRFNFDQLISYFRQWNLNSTFVNQKFVVKKQPTLFSK